MTQCPTCGKRLLSHASARCNWCGAAINDADYQARAQAERDAFFAHAAAHDAQSLAAAEALLLPGAGFDPLMLAPMPSRRMPLLSSRQAPPAALGGTSARMPAREAYPGETNGENTSADAGATGEPIPSEADEAGARFRHLEL